MTLTLTFVISGIGIVVLLMAKQIEQKYSVAIFFLNIVSKGDAHVREFSHQLAYFYDTAKERTAFVVRKQLPMRIKSNWNKFSTITKEVGQDYLEKIRDARLIKPKDDGISEFFKSINEVEKGSGEIEEDANFDHYREPHEMGLQEAESPK